MQTVAFPPHTVLTQRGCRHAQHIAGVQASEGERVIVVGTTGGGGGAGRTRRQQRVCYMQGCAAEGQAHAWGRETQSPRSWGGHPILGRLCSPFVP